MPTELGEGIIAVGLGIEKLRAANDELEAEVRALREALREYAVALHESRAEVRALRLVLEELLDALDESHGGTFDPYPGRLLTAYTAARALAPEPSEPGGD